MMYLARILYPVEVLGCGKRIGLWFDGCPHHCEGCSNPELWVQQPRYQIAAERVIALTEQLAQEHPVDGVTVTGGEPFFQPEALLRIVTAASRITEDILIYTGYTLDELTAMHSDTIEQILQKNAVLIDGRYIAAQNQNLPMRGSANQTVHILNDRLRPAYEAYMTQENRIQYFMIGRSAVSVGIHRPDFQFGGKEHGVSTEMAQGAEHLPSGEIPSGA